MGSDPERPEDPGWDAWARGEARCPLCLGMDEDEFQAMCDCSRAEFEASGEQLSIYVIGHPESETPVYPIQHG
jgi:hypothetical protein